MCAGITWNPGLFLLPPRPTSAYPAATQNRGVIGVNYFCRCATIILAG